MMFYSFDGFSPFHTFGFIFMPIFWGLAIYGIFLIVQWLLGSSNKSDSDNALKIVKERYARGEITREEFERIKKDIK